MISAEFTVNGDPRVGTHVAAYGSTVTLSLLTYAGAASIQWEVAARSHTDVLLPALTLGGVPLGRQATCSMPSDPGGGEGRAFLVRCTVTDALGARDVRSAVFGAANANSQVPFCPGEEYERDETQGWIGPLNTMLART